MMSNIFDKLRSGVPVNMMDKEYMPAIEYMQKTTLLNFRINNTVPTTANLRPLEEEFFDGRLMKHLSFPRLFTLIFLIK
jgi:hypothetical protein